jgi:predicted nucleic acid-binding protein
VKDRLFLDANVLFSAAYREGAGVTRLWDIPDATLTSSAYAVAEAQRNLISDEQLRRLRKLLGPIELVDAVRLPPDTPSVELPDKDLPILAGAIAAEATHLVTGDLRHFGRFCGNTLQGIVLLTPAEYLNRR